MPERRWRWRGWGSPARAPPRSREAPVRSVRALVLTLALFLLIGAVAVHAARRDNQAIAKATALTGGDPTRGPALAIQHGCACKPPIEMSPLSPFQMSLSSPDGCWERVTDDGDCDEPHGDRSDARAQGSGSWPDYGD